MMRMMYCATWVQVTARMPPIIEQTRMPPRPTKQATSKLRFRKREAIWPTPTICAVT
jgi:hypothetical protein